MKWFLQRALKILARATTARYQPRLVGVTGSVGKTGSRIAIVSVLQERWRVAGSQKNLNNEIGLPLAILGEPDSGYRNPLAWLMIFARAMRQILFFNKNYPEVLVLEYGVDHPGDMDYLLTIARPEVAVITAITATHLEFLGSVEGVAQEKGKLVTTLAPSGMAVLNLDFAEVAAWRAKIKAKVIGYGESELAQVRIIGSQVSQSNGVIQGMSFRLSVGGSTVPVLVRGVVGKPVASMAAVGAAVGQALALSVLEITRGLEKFQPPPGRLRLIAGVEGSLLLDDTYNSSPQAVAEAIKILSQLPLASGARRWAILGDMLELGENKKFLHRAVGRKVAEAKIDFLVTVGELAQEIAAGARAAGLAADRLWQVDDSESVASLVKPRLRAGDIILIKASQGVRAEKAVKALMAEPAKAKELLVRQTKPWL